MLKGEPRAIAICHCTHCQRQSGSLFSFNLVVREADYQPSGETAVYVDKGDSGQPVYRHFCGRCGSPILAKIASAPGKVVVKAGTLERLEGLQPKAEMYTDHDPEKWLPIFRKVLGVRPRKVTSIVPAYRGKNDGIRCRWRIPKWRATVDEDEHYCFAVPL